MDPRYKSPLAVVEDRDESAFRNLHTLTTAVRWLLYAGAALALLGLVSAWMQLDLLSGPYTQAEGRENDLREGAIGGLAFLVAIATFICFGRWILLAHRNLQALGARHVEFTPGWALGWFFIPVASLWKPYQAMKSLWQMSRHVHKPDIQETTWVLPTWWTLWLVSVYLGGAIFRMQTRGENTIERLTVMTRVAIGNDLVDVLLNLVAALLVGRIWLAQRRQHENPGEFAPPPGFADGASPAT
jgi:hypothetical protein